MTFLAGFITGFLVSFISYQLGRRNGVRTAHERLRNLEDHADRLVEVTQAISTALTSLQNIVSKLAARGAGA